MDRAGDREWCRGEIVLALGFVTVMLALPIATMSAAPICAVSCVLLTKLVMRFAPFHCTIALLAKLVPLTVSVKLAPPTAANAGLRLLIVGIVATTCFQFRTVAPKPILKPSR